MFWYVSPHLCVGFLFLILYPAPRPVRPAHLCHTPFLSHHFVTHHLSHTLTLCHTPSFTPLCHTPTFTASLSHTIFHTTLSHTTLSHTIFDTPPLSHTIFHTPSLTHHGTLAHLRFPWQAWHLVTSTFVSRGRRGTWRHLPAFCVAGVVTLVALGGALGPAWQSLVMPSALCVAGVALMALGWLWWHAWARIGRR